MEHVTPSSARSGTGSGSGSENTADLAVGSATEAAPVATPFIVGIDGRSGSGKTVLTQRLAEALSENYSVTVFKLDDLYRGWRGLAEGVEIFSRDVLPELAAGRPAKWQDWDWSVPGERGDGAPGQWHVTQPSEVIICEGVCVGARENRPLLDSLIWLRAPLDIRYRRAMDRDGETYYGHWDTWAAQEQEFLDQDQIYDAADLVLMADSPDERHHTSARAMVLAKLQTRFSRDK